MDDSPEQVYPGPGWLSALAGGTETIPRPKGGRADERVWLFRRAIKEVGAIILRKNLKENADSQTIEDALCLVFFETQFHDSIEKTPPDKMKTILQRCSLTWDGLKDPMKQFQIPLPHIPEPQRIRGVVYVG